MSRIPRQPLVAIVGATGTGKSELAVEIASRCNGEIINGDAMQLYHGLPIITNKITPAETKGVPHHLLGCIGLEEETWTVSKFVGEALRIIEEIRARGRLPVLVGGTHYYTQSLLFHETLANESFAEQKSDRSAGLQEFPILEAPTDVMLEKLKEVDPVMAERWHPNERRKIRRSLELYLKTGKPASQVYGEQQMNRQTPVDLDHGHEGAESMMRFQTLLFWVHASKDVLHKRTDSRILKMLDKGLLAEVAELSAFRETYEVSSASKIDQTRGIWVSIGYKEFLDYQAALNGGVVSEKELESLKMAATEKMQAATRQYANRQVRWIRTKLLHALSAAGQKDRMFLFDGSDLAQWENKVIEPAAEITQQFLSGQTLPLPARLSSVAQEMLTPKTEYDLSQRRDLWEKKTCGVCRFLAVTENDWQLHTKSRAHRRAVAAKKKHEKQLLNESNLEKHPAVDLIQTLDLHLDALQDTQRPDA